MTGSEIFKRTATYEREASSIRLHAPQWKLLLAFDGQRALSEVALGAGMPFSEAVTQTENYLKQDWIAEQPISLDEYLKRASAGGSVIPPAVVINEPKPEHKAEMKAEAKPEPKPEFKAAAKPENGTAPAVIVPPLPIAPLKENTTTARPMRLSAIVDFIVSLAESIPLGQLLAYRVFLRVPPEILQSEEIVSIHLIDDTSVIRTEPLQKAISAAVQEIIRRPLPESVYVAA